MPQVDRKSNYKLPPTTIRDKLVSQESRRAKALEEQKRRRAQKVDSSRQLDAFSALNLGGTDDEDDAEDDETPLISSASVAQYASMLAHDEMPNATTSFEKLPFPGFVAAQGRPFPIVPFSEPPPEESKKKNNSNKKRKNKRRTNKPSKWADKCMYAELLEMVSNDMWSQGGLIGDEEVYNNGLPRDLETAWVALAPVPAGKRCLAVTHQSAGVAGIVPNTTLRSRLLGKTLIQRFPSPLPPLTILDCILDANWRDNGILHVLDVVKWKGQDVGDCEARFRFWWRDTRLAELTQMLPPTSTHSRSHFVSVAQHQHQHSTTALKYRFPYPTAFVPVPYHTTTTFSALDEVVIPASRAVREVDVIVPSPPRSSAPEGNASMEVEPRSSADHFQDPHMNGFIASPPVSETLRARILADGLLLYVAEASYEPGTGPLSSWIPIFSEERPYGSTNGDHISKESPLDLFQRIIQRKLSDRIGLCAFTQITNMAIGGPVTESYMDV